MLWLFIAGFAWHEKTFCFLLFGLEKTHGMDPQVEEVAKRNLIIEFELSAEHKKSRKKERENNDEYLKPKCGQKGKEEDFFITDMYMQYSGAGGGEEV